MSKRYSDQLAEWVKKNKSVKKRDRNLVMYQAVKDDVRDALADGYSVRTIWKHMYETNRVTIGYDMFLIYTNLLIRKVPTQTKTDPPTEPKKGEETTEDKKTQTTNSSKQSTGFVFDPSPRKEDWI